ncbi:uncharacterized protein RAG0_08173 [Rhynchosporium agropyri]|uniref:MARVEL domain-containing protein n=1 Tax=Rhynchosporium agropyri TaxID=914238 RepID=A0A1E1KPG8_9HELO|nr:uncharacterized protein RAG0_08173 [Rhynchosporium agropyri]
MSRSLGQQMVRSIGLFQALVAIPALFILGEWALYSLFTYNVLIYDFIASICNTIFAAGILFIVLVQRKVDTTPLVTLYLELAKSGFATASWLWLLLDTAFGPNRYSSEEPARGPRIARVIISIIVLLIAFYPSLLYAMVEAKRPRTNDVEGVEAQGQIQAEVRGEREPLLG